MINQLVISLLLITTILGVSGELVSEDKKCPILKKTKVELLANFDVLDFGISDEVFKNDFIDLSIINATKASVLGNFSESNQSEKIVIFNIPFRPEILSKVPREKLVYFLWEPWSIASEYYDSYGSVYTWDDSLVDNKKFFKIYYPGLLPMIEDRTSFEEKKLCVMVAGSDIDPKSNGTELYSERIRMVEFFETKPKGEFAVYGRQWTSRNYRDYIGPIPGSHSGKEKVATLDKYRFSVCFENSKNIKGYITEKIFCCFTAGCVPIYWGASNIDTYIPKECYIDYRDFQDREQLYQFIKTMTKDTYNKYLENIQVFLSSEKAKVFTSEYLLKTLYAAIKGSDL